MLVSKAPKRPRDPNQLAKLIVDIATGDQPEPKSPVTGRKGGKARAEMLPKKRRIEIARKAASARWTKKANSADQV